MNAVHACIRSFTRCCAMHTVGVGLVCAIVFDVTSVHERQVYVTSISGNAIRVHGAEQLHEAFQVPSQCHSSEVDVNKDGREKSIQERGRCAPSRFTVYCRHRAACRSIASAVWNERTSCSAVGLPEQANVLFSDAIDSLCGRWRLTAAAANIIFHRDSLNTRETS